MAEPPRAWRILIVDDSLDDAELAELALRHSGLQAEYQRVERANTLRDALATFQPDIVLCDVNLPGFSGVEAFEIVRELHPAARFVFLTGALRDGAALPEVDGVLLKDDLASLPAMVSRLLRVP